MTEVSRFFDTALYSEAEQAEVQKRWRDTGVLYEVGTRLALSAPGGMFVRVADGEAFVEGFWYKNTTTKDLPVAANTSGSTRIDAIVLRLNRTGNVLTAEIKQGTPGAGLPTLDAVAGGSFEFLLGQVSVATGTLAVTAGMITDNRTYGKKINVSDEINVLPPPSEYYVGRPDMIRRVLTVDPVTKALYYAEPVASRPNLLNNASFRINQRNNGYLFTSSTETYFCDLWRTSYVCLAGNISMGITALGGLGNSAYNGIQFAKQDSSAYDANSYHAAIHILEGVDVQSIHGRPMVLGFWAMSNKVGVYGANVEQFSGATPYRFLGTFTINVPNVWEFKYISMPWQPLGTWALDASASLAVRFIAAAGSNYKDAVNNAWSNTAAKYASSSITNSLTTLNDFLYIGAPKLEYGTIPTLYQAVDYKQELDKAYRYLYVARQNQIAFMANNAIIAMAPLRASMRAVPSFSVPVVPTFSNGASPGANQIAGIFTGTYVSSFTYQSWSAYSAGQELYSTVVGSTTVPTTPAGVGGMLLLGTNISMVFSAEMA